MAVRARSRAGVDRRDLDRHRPGPDDEVDVRDDVLRLLAAWPRRVPSTTPPATGTGALGVACRWSRADALRRGAAGADAGRDGGRERCCRRPRGTIAPVRMAKADHDHPAACDWPA